MSECNYRQLCNLGTRYHKLCGGVRGNLLFEYVHDKVVNWFNVPHARFLDYSSDTFNTHLDLGSHTLIQNMHQRTHKWGHTPHRKRHTHANVHIQFSLAENQRGDLNQTSCLWHQTLQFNQHCMYIIFFYMSIDFASTIYIYTYSYLCTSF